MRKLREISLDYQCNPDIADDESVYEVYRQLFEDIAMEINKDKKLKISSKTQHVEK